MKRRILIQEGPKVLSVSVVAIASIASVVVVIVVTAISNGPVCWIGHVASFMTAFSAAVTFLVTTTVVAVMVTNMVASTAHGHNGACLCACVSASGP